MSNSRPADAVPLPGPIDGRPHPDALAVPSVGQKLVVIVEDIAFGGEGVARAGDFVIFIPFVVLGEEVEIELVEVKKRFARARLLRIILPSSDRVAPRCEYFGDCGGCQYQHMAYPRQLEIKRKQIVDLLQRVGGISAVLVDPVMPCPQPYGYRNRIMIRSQWNKPEQRLNVGFIRADNRLVVDIDHCDIAEPVVSDQIKQVRANPPPKGGIKVVLRRSPEGWDLPRDSFFQNNFHLLPGLVTTVREKFASAGTRFLIDAYCGVGFFSLELADLAERFVGVEVDLPAIQAARRNAARRGIVNGEFQPGRTEDLLPSLLDRYAGGKTTLILDPPRTGCPPESLELIRSVGPAQVIYVSCHPATLARDLNILGRDGVFELNRVTPLDMFPQTQHVECVADLRLGQPSGTVNQPCLGPRP